MMCAGMLSTYCSEAAASVAETMALKESVQNLKVTLIGFFPVLCRLTKSESAESLLWQAGGSSRSRCAPAVPRKRSDRSPCVAAAPSKPPGHGHRAATRAGPAALPEAAKPEKESRSQKHTRVKICLVLLVKKSCLTYFHGTWFVNIFLLKVNYLHLCLLLNFILFTCVSESWRHWRECCRSKEWKRVQRKFYHAQKIKTERDNNEE